MLTDYWTDVSSVIVPTVEQIREDLLHRIEDITEGVLAERPEGGAVPTLRIRIVKAPRERCSSTAPRSWISWSSAATAVTPSAVPQRRTEPTLADN